MCDNTGNLAPISSGTAQFVLTSNGTATPSFKSAPAAQAWVNFAGASGTINKGYNVTSVTMNSTGNYTVNFTNAMADANYVVQVSTTGTAASNSYSTLTTTTAIITTYTITSGALGSVSAVNPTSVSVVFFD
jgi:hypothetical protein